MSNAAIDILIGAGEVTVIMFVAAVFFGVCL